NTQRVAQRVMPGGHPNRVYMTQGGTGSGSASPSQGGSVMGGGEGGQSGQGGRSTYMMPPTHTMRVGIQPPRMASGMGGNGGGPPKRAHSILPPKQGMLVTRTGSGMGHMRGGPQMGRFPSGSGAPPARMMNVVVRDGGPQGALMRGGMTPSGSGVPMAGMPPSLQTRNVPPSRTMINPRSQSQIPAPTLHLPTLDASSSSSNSPSAPPQPPTNPSSDTVPPSQGGPLPSISLSSSSSSFPNPTSHHSM
ncbi:hypothetical protein PMAYCL1PPCAC_12726, partial [Pristionchus mayeri]